MTHAAAVQWDGNAPHQQVGNATASTGDPPVGNPLPSMGEAPREWSAHRTRGGSAQVESDLVWHAPSLIWHDWSICPSRVRPRRFEWLQRTAGEHHAVSYTHLRAHETLMNL
eukprot:6897803-Prymnesium_polylepis.2